LCGGLQSHPWTRTERETLCPQKKERNKNKSSDTEGREVINKEKDTGDWHYYLRLSGEGGENFRTGEFHIEKEKRAHTKGSRMLGRRDVRKWKHQPGGGLGECP